MQESRAIDASLGHAWILDLLFGRPPIVTWSVAGALPAGYERVERFAILPAASGRTMALSLAARRGAASAMTSYNALRPRRRRVARRALGIGLRTGLAQPLLRNMVDVGVRVGATHEQAAAELLMAYLSGLLSVEKVVVAISAGPGPYRKPVLQILSSSGTPVAHAKVGWNSWTRDGVRREVAALDACASRSMRICVPSVRAAPAWQGLDLLVTEPLPRRVRGLRLSAALPDAAVLREIAELSSCVRVPIAASRWWHAVRSRIRAIAVESAARASLEHIAGQIERASGRVPLEFGFSHGDLVPWNLATQGDRLYAWDWESSTPDAPVGFDAVHFHFQAAFVGRGLKIETASAVAARAAWPALRELGIPATDCDLVVTLHLLELYLRHEEARSSAGDTDHRFYPAVARLLQERLARTSATAPTAAGGR
jgi:hypothetical protein